MPVYIQIKLKQNEPKFIEVTPRLDGCHLWRLIKYATGFDLLNTTITHLTEQAIDDLIPEGSEKTWILELLYGKPQTKFLKENHKLNDPHYHE